MKFILTAIVFSLLLLSCNNRKTKGSELNKDTASVAVAMKDIETGEKEEVLCECFLLDSGKVQLYDNVQGNVIDTIQNDYEMESFFSIEIYSQHNDWFNIRAKAIKNEASGWVLNKSYFATYSRNYTDTLFVYRKPDITSGTVCTFPEYFTTPMKVIECKEKWIKVAINHNNQTCLGWVLQKMTCPNPYTTCP